MRKKTTTKNKVEIDRINLGIMAPCFIKIPHKETQTLIPLSSSYLYQKQVQKERMDLTMCLFHRV